MQYKRICMQQFCNDVIRLISAKLTCAETEITILPVHERQATCVFRSQRTCSLCSSQSPQQQLLMEVHYHWILYIYFSSIEGYHVTCWLHFYVFLLDLCMYYDKTIAKTAHQIWAWIQNIKLSLYGHNYVTASYTSCQKWVK